VNTIWSRNNVNTIWYQFIGLQFVLVQVLLLKHRSYLSKQIISKNNKMEFNIKVVKCRLLHSKLLAFTATLYIPEAHIWLR